MSGGHFDYKQHQISQIAEEIEELIDKNGKKDRWGDSYDYSEEVLEKFRETAHECKRLAEMVQRVDWLVSGDDGVDSFFERWDDEVREKYENR